MSPLTVHPGLTTAEELRMRHWVRFVLATLLVTLAVTAAVVGLDWLWYKLPGSTPVAAVLGDPRIRVASQLPNTPARVPIYAVASDITVAQVEETLGGRAQISDGWVTWHGRSPLDPKAALQLLNPGVPWRTQGNFVGPAAKGLRVRSGGLSSAFTGTAVASNSFGTFQTNGGYLVQLSIPAHRIEQVGTTKVIPAAVALLDVRHHRATTRLVPDTIALLPQRLAGARTTRMPAVTDVWLALAEDPANPGRSKPVWVFDPVAEADAQR